VSGSLLVYVFLMSASIALAVAPIRTDGLCFDPAAACHHLRTVDSTLGALMERTGEFRLRPEPAQSLFTALLRSIVYQQLSGKAAATIYARVNRIFVPRRVPTPRALLEVSPERLRSAGLSAAKTLAVRDLAARTLDGTVPSLARIRRMEDEEIIERLTAVRGIGRWTAEMLLMFRLGRPDVFPLSDLGIRKGFNMTFRRGKPASLATMSRRGDRWRPYRSVASWYLWRALEL
jgi:3-methyladenine DNA glycosylase/8-oxoguanine DNA glycosylase